MSPPEDCSLSAEQNERFDALVSLAGLDRQTVRTYGKQARRVSVASLAELRDLMGSQSEQMRVNSVLNRGNADTEGDDARSEFDVAMQYIFGNGTLSDTHVASLEARYFPLDLNVVAQEDKTIPAGETWVIARDGRPEVHHYRTLKMERGSKIEIYSTLLALTCQRLISES